MPPSPRLKAGWQLFALCAAWSAARAAAAGGPLLVLDAGSLFPPPTRIYGGGSTISSIGPAKGEEVKQPMASASECQARCEVLPGCGSFAFCGEEGGCGAGCASYVEAHPRHVVKDGEDPFASLKLPLRSFGPFLAATSGPTGCQKGAPDKWPQGMCVLYTQAGNASATLAAGGGGRNKRNAAGVLVVSPSAGWSLGALPAPGPGCAGLSAAACAACAATPSPGACLACARDKAIAPTVAEDGIRILAPGAARGSSGNIALDQCATCAKLGDAAGRDVCVACVTGRKPCVSCVPHPGSPSQVPLESVAGCISCVESRGKRFVPPCVTCALAADAGKCSSCLGSFYPELTCRTSVRSNCYVPDADNPCARCQSVTKSPKAYEHCIKCYHRPASANDCDTCGGLQAADEQEQCFACAAAAPATGRGGCGGCFASAPKGAARDECLACVLDKSTAGARDLCAACSGADMDAAARGRCLKCVRGGSGAGGAGCASCARAAKGGAVFDACLACFSSPDSGPDCQDCNMLEKEADKGRCYRCVSASKLQAPEDAAAAPLGSCAACINTPNEAACVACNADAAVPTVAKGWCSGCTAGGGGGSGAGAGDKAAACVGCLKQKLKADATADDYQEKCGIKMH